MEPLIAQSIPAMEAKLGPDITKRLHSSAKEYEAVFLGQMMQIMFQDIDMNSDGIGGGNAANDTYKGMLADQMGEAVANGHGIGLADPIYRTLLQAQLSGQEAH